MATPSPFSMSVPKPPTLQPFAPPGGADSSAFRLSQGTRALEHSAAARGTYFTPNTMRSLVDYNQQAAGDDFGANFNRSLQTHNANQNTAQTGFNNDMTTYGAERSAWAADEGFKLSQSQAADDRAFSLVRTQQQADDRRAQENAALAATQQQNARATMERERQAQAQREAENAGLQAQQQQNAQRDAQAHSAMAEAQKAAEAHRQQDALAEAQRRQAIAEQQRQEMERQRLENEAIQRAAAARQNAATNAVPFTLAPPLGAPARRYAGR